MLVPLRVRYLGRRFLPRTMEEVFVAANVLPNDKSETVPAPGATRSGFAAKSIAVGPDELKFAIWSSPRSVVPIVLDAPTVSTQGALAGAVMAPYCSCPAAFLPMLPAAATTVMPLSVTTFAASVKG